MAVEIILLTVLPALLVAAAVWDLTSFTIPNFLILALLASFAVFVMAATLGGAMTWNEAGLHLLTGLAGLAAGMALFAKGWVGGGDAKLFAAISLWLGWNIFLEYTILACILGGGLTIAIILLRRFASPILMKRESWLSRLADSQAGVPYGIALSAAALMILPHTEIFRTALAL